jgi:hypothetical protein
MFNGIWKESDENPNGYPTENQIKNYLDTVMKVVIAKYSEPFPWGDPLIKIPWWRRIFMRFIQLLWF